MNGGPARSFQAIRMGSRRRQSSYAKRQTASRPVPTTAVACGVERECSLSRSQGVSRPVCKATKRCLHRVCSLFSAKTSQNSYFAGEATAGTHSSAVDSVSSPARKTGKIATASQVFRGRILIFDATLPLEFNTPQRGEISWQKPKPKLHPRLQRRKLR